MQQGNTSVATEEEILANLIAVHEDGIRRLASCGLRDSLQRALPALQLAYAPLPALSALSLLELAS